MANRTLEVVTTESMGGKPIRNVIMPDNETYRLREACSLDDGYGNRLFVLSALGKDRYGAGFSGIYTKRGDAWSSEDARCPKFTSGKDLEAEALDLLAQYQG
ncbi:hypothetical protein HY640_04435 [Candidatus Woesearchaeota archaeon]|nr:hypothetical protein [Candidatus Woesearchaeota archaeon]